MHLPGMKVKVLSYKASLHLKIKTSQELRMLSSVTINCQVTKIVMNPGSQLSVLKSVSQMSQVPLITPLDVLQWRYIGRVESYWRVTMNVENVVLKCQKCVSVSMLTSILDYSLRLFSKYLCLCLFVFRSSLHFRLLSLSCCPQERHPTLPLYDGGWWVQE